MRIDAGRTGAYVRASPIIAEALQRVATKEAHTIVQVRYYICRPWFHYCYYYCGIVGCNMCLAVFSGSLVPQLFQHALQEAEAALLAAARQWQYLQADGSVLLATNVYTVITATAG